MNGPYISQIVNLQKPGWLQITLNPVSVNPSSGFIFPERDNTGICPLKKKVTIGFN